MADVPRVIVTTHDGTIVGDLDPARLAGLVAVSEVNGENAMTVTTTQELTKGDRLLWRDGMGVWHEYVVESDECPHDMPDAPMHTYYAVWSVQHDLSGTYLTSMPGTGGTPASATDTLTAALAGTARWTVGTVGIGTTGSASFWHLSGWEAMQELVKVWGGEVRATITVSPTTGVTGRAVDLLVHVGATTATRRYDYGHDATGITRTVMDEQWTASVMPLGAAEQTDEGGYGRKITIESVNGGSAILTNDAAVPLTRVPNGSGGWEVPVQIVENSECKTPDDLKAWALEHLDEWTTPKVSYEVGVAQLDRAGESALGVALGDECSVVDSTFCEGGLRLTARVMRIEDDLLDPTQTTLTISNLQGTLGDTLTSIAQATADVRGMVEGMSAAQASQEWVQNLLDRINADINATGGYAYITEGQGIRTYDVAVTDPLIGAEASAVCEIKGGTMRIANTKGAQGQWQWKTVFTSGRILAELIDAIGSSSGYHAQLTPTGLDVYDGSTRVAHFGADSVIGETSGIHIELESDGVTFYDGADRMQKLMDDGLYYGWRSDVSEPVAETSFSDFGDEWNLRNAIGSRESTKHASIYNYAERCWISDANRMDSAEVTAVTRNADGIPEASIEANSGFGNGYAGGTARIVAKASSAGGTAYVYADRVQVEDPTTGNTFGAFPTYGVVAQGTNVPANGYHDFTVSFGHTYAAAPTVHPTILSTSSATTFNCDIYLRSVSTTGFTARIMNREGSDRSPGFHWFAIGN